MINVAAGILVFLIGLVGALMIQYGIKQWHREKKLKKDKIQPNFHYTCIMLMKYYGDYNGYVKWMHEIGAEGHLLIRDDMKNVGCVYINKNGRWMHSKTMNEDWYATAMTKTEYSKYMNDNNLKYRYKNMARLEKDYYGQLHVFVECNEWECNNARRGWYQQYKKYTTNPGAIMMAKGYTLYLDRYMCWRLVDSVSFRVLNAITYTDYAERVKTQDARLADKHEKEMEEILHYAAQHKCISQMPDPTPAKHDKPGVVGLENLKNPQTGAAATYLRGIAVVEDVYITVDAVEKPCITSRINEQIKNWHGYRRTGKFGTDTILLAPEEWEEFIAYLEMKDCCNPIGRKNIIDKKKEQIYLNHVVFMSPQVKGIKVL